MHYTSRRRLLGTDDMTKRSTTYTGSGVVSTPLKKPRQRRLLRQSLRQFPTSTDTSQSTVTSVEVIGPTSPSNSSSTATSLFATTSSTFPPTSTAASEATSFNPVSGATFISGITSFASGTTFGGSFTPNSATSSPQTTITSVIRIPSATSSSPVSGPVVSDPSPTKSGISKPVIAAIVIVALLLIGVCCFLKQRARRRQRRRRFIEESPRAYTLPSTPMQSSSTALPAMSRDPSKADMYTNSDLGRLTIPTDPSHTGTLRNDTNHTPSEQWSDSVTAVSRGVFYPPPPRTAPALGQPRIGITNPDPIIEDPPLLARDLHPTAFASPASPRAPPSAAAAAKLKEAEAGLLSWRVDNAPGPTQASGSAADESLRAEVDALRREVERLRAREAERSAEEGERPPAYGVG